MKITKAQLKQIIKEELDAVNEIDVELMTNADKIMLIGQALAKMAGDFSPAILPAIAALSFRKALGMDKKEDIVAATKEAVEEYVEENNP
jgi:hypothetical protein